MSCCWSHSAILGFFSQHEVSTSSPPRKMYSDGKISNISFKKVRRNVYTSGLVGSSTSLQPIRLG